MIILFFTIEFLFPWKIKYRIAWTTIVLTKGLQQTFLRVICLFSPWWIIILDSWGLVHICIYRFSKKKFHSFTCGKPWSEEAAESNKAENLANELKSLKQISFPEMDSDALPSTYVMKVVACVGKWQMKLLDLANMMDSSNATMKPFPVSINHII